MLRNWTSHFRRKKKNIREGRCLLRADTYCHPRQALLNTVLEDHVPGRSTPKKQEEFVSLHFKNNHVIAQRLLGALWQHHRTNSQDSGK